MTTILLLAATVLALATAFVVLLERFRPGRRSALDELEAASVVLHTQDGQSFRGALTAVRPDAFVLERAELLHTSGPQPLQGPVIVPRANTAFFQRLAGGDA